MTNLLSNFLTQLNEPRSTVHLEIVRDKVATIQDLEHFIGRDCGVSNPSIFQPYWSGIEVANWAAKVVVLPAILS
jgi:hypothetical protein